MGLGGARTGWQRPAIALIVAYALLLQGFLSVLLVTQVAAGFAENLLVLCLSGATSAKHPAAPDAPRHSGTCILCSVAACGSGAATAALPPGLAVAMPVGQAGAADSPPAAHAVLPPRHRTPRLSQAPPLSA